MRPRRARAFSGPEIHRGRGDPEEIPEVLVTGATKGIGLSIAEHFAREGAAVAICARQAEEVAATVARLRAMGVAATGRALDVSDAPALQA
jgi:3-oxoacyl-[acyl-carrier protein] reductase